MAVRSYLVLACLVVLTACSDQAAPDEVVVSANQFTSLPTIDPQPVLRFTIPDSVGGASAEMGRVFRLSNGFVVADWDGQRLLVFSPEGRLTKVLGRGGSGPGEFQALSLIEVLPGDSLLVWDPYLRRITWVESSTGRTRQHAVPATTLYGGNPIVGALRDGRLVVKHESPVAATPDNPAALVSVVALMESGEVELDTIASDFPVRRIDSGGYRFFAPGLQVATDGRSLFIGYSTAFEIVEYGGQGQRLGEFQRPWQPTSVTDQVKSAIRASITRPDMAPGFLNDDRFESSIPAFGEILPSGDGTLWVSSYRAPYQATDSVSIFSPDRRYMGTLRLPLDFRPTQVGADYLLGTGTSDDGDFEIRIYRVRWREQAQQ